MHVYCFPGIPYSREEINETCRRGIGTRMKGKGVERAKREKETVERESRKEGRARERKLKRRNKSIFLRSAVVS
jgi:hypothetical protein